jgi:syntenin-1
LIVDPKMPLYPTLEDLKVDEIMTAQTAYMNPQYPPQQPYAPPSTYPYPQASASTTTPYPASNAQALSLYPNLSSYMGLSLSSIAGAQPSEPGQLVVAPVSQSNIIGIKRAEIQPGLRKVTLCKDSNGKIGLTLRDISKGIFVACVFVNTPASLGGLRFGDQILEVNGQAMAGFSADKAASFLKHSKADKIEVVVRDRPFERTITLNKDSNGYVGFCFTNSGKITSIVKDSSAARNGLLIDHQLVEVDGKNVIGMTDKEISRVVESAPRTVTVTIMPSVLYEHMVKCIGQSVLRKHMDRSVPDV